MLEKLLSFFRNLFSALFGRSSKTEEKTPTRSSNQDLPSSPDPIINETAEPVLAEDASEVTPDTVIVVVHEEDLDISKEVTAGNETIDLPEPATKEPSDDATQSEPAEDPIMDEPIEDPINSGGNDPVIQEPEIPVHTPRYLWCLDNGHGNQTAGKRSPELEDGRQLLEYEFNRDVVARIIKGLNDRGVAWFNVVPEEDIDDFLEGRVKRANEEDSKLPKLFVSVHANAAPAPYGKWGAASVSGIETWFYHSSRRGRKLAAIFQKKLVGATGWKNRHIKSRPTRQFYVLRNTRMTAVLTENGFYNNKAECLELLKPEMRQKIADAHIEAIMEVEEKGL